MDIFSEERTRVKGSAYIASTMLACQNEPVDMLMYYDAGPGGMNGLWTETFYEKRKAYYSIYAFNKLYQLGTNVKVSTDSENLYIAAAKNGSEAAVMISHFNDDDNAFGIEFELDLSGFEGKTMEFYLLDKHHNLEKIKEQAYTESNIITLSRNATILIEIKKIYIPKIFLIDFFCSLTFRSITRKSLWHIQTLNDFSRKMKHKK